MEILNIDVLKEILHGTYSNLKHESIFKSVAEFFMMRKRLKCGENIYKIVECEFYFFQENGDHKDIYTHKAKEQLSFGKWYDHGSGLDITIGNEKDTYGGILIRSLQNVNSGQYINGPLNIKKELFFNMGDVLNPVYSPYFIDILDKQISPIYSVKRVGLNKNKQNANFYYSRKYRFISDLLTANKLAEKENIFKELYKEESLSKNEILKLLNYEPGFLKDDTQP